jgi:hypothetical protein
MSKPKQLPVIYIVARGHDEYITGFLYPPFGEGPDRDEDCVKVAPGSWAHFGKQKSLAYMWTKEESAQAIADRIPDAFVIDCLPTRGPMHGILIPESKRK